MLTNVYYYNHYRPFIVKSDRIPKTATRPVYTSASPAVWDSGGKSYTLNKSFKRDTLSYARELSSNITRLKDATLNISRDYEELSTVLDENGLEEFREQVSLDLRALVHQINSAISFSERQQHSETITNFGSRLTEVVLANTEILKSAGVELDKNGNLTFENTIVETLDSEQLSQLLSDIYEVSDIVFSQTSDLLLRPLSEYMNFKNLGYYYNYKYGKIGDDSTRLIESGMIIDRAI